MNDTGFPYKRQSQSLGQGTKRQTLGNHNRNRLSRAQQQALHVEFRSDELMQGQPPSHTAEDFQKPRLRKCPFRLDTVRWKSATKLGDGYDGCVWKVEFGNEGTFALKVVSLPVLLFCLPFPRPTKLSFSFGMRSRL